LRKDLPVWVLISNCHNCPPVSLSLSFLLSSIFWGNNIVSPGYITGKTEIDFDEFIEVLKKADKKSTPDKELLSTAFSEFDTDDTGLMTPKQLRYSQFLSLGCPPSLQAFALITFIFLSFFFLSLVFPCSPHDDG